MLAAVTPERGQGFGVREVDISQPIGAEVLIDVHASGLCRSDLTAEQGSLGVPFPIVLGHEPAGVVAAVGPNVTRFRAGDRVAASVVTFCGACRQCLAGRTWRCTDRASLLRRPEDGPVLSLDGEPIAANIGAFAQQVLLNQNQVVPIPDGLPFAQAAVIGCSVITGAGAVLNAADVRTGDAVVIIGAGGVGLNTISGAVLAGACPIIVADLDDRVLETARRFGATHVVNSAREDLAARVQEVTVTGADHVFDVIGAAAVTQGAFDLLSKGGALYVVGIGHDDPVVHIHTHDMTRGARTYAGVWVGNSNVQHDMPMYARLYLEGRYELDALVSRRIALDEVAAGFGMLREGDVNRVVVTDFGR